ncbi:hypothetical protein [Helicobacter turcicus]|uniref:Bacteriocin n=1 Tax=Helicobacter turcicus TaxID=2867412 RepID=A0ABS7JNQ6_9HELI|nr:hypothetical protein [Helicobacter turcicus]MBX7491031.1 hypothetical protein [Helicobacter turcicus]
MKKLILGVFLSFGFISISYAEELDLISLATHGKLNESSLGVRVLNDEEMRKVVGGIRYLGTNYGYTYVTMPLSNNYNANIRPQTNNQAIYSNAFMKWYKPPYH